MTELIRIGKLHPGDDYGGGAEDRTLAARLHPSLPTTHTEIRPAQGKIQDAILRALPSDSPGLSPARIRDLVSDQLDANVSYDTVSSFLSVAARNPPSRIERATPGIYVIVS